MKSSACAHRVVLDPSAINKPRKRDFRCPQVRPCTRGKAGVLPASYHTMHVLIGEVGFSGFSLGARAVLVVARFLGELLCGLAIGFRRSVSTVNR